jgi:signal transduction histidine kinase
VLGATFPRHPVERPLRPLIWRLPLVVILIAGLAMLRRVDHLLRREYSQEASTQAVQTDALLESFIKQRTALLNSLRTLVVTSRSVREGETRFAVLASEFVVGAPDLFSIYLLNERGVVRGVYRRSPDELELRSENHFDVPERALTLRRAARYRTAVASGTVKLSNGVPGMFVYLPIIQRGQVVGYIGGAFPYATVFNDALAGHLQGRFAYRVTDEDGEVIAVSENYPTLIDDHVTRQVSLPGGRHWQLDVAVPAFQPLTARLVNWIVGVLVLVLLGFLVWREEARARRFAEYSRDLEVLSRNLLDANMRLEERNLQIAEANRAKSRFLANVSHELRTPLNAIVGYNSLAMDGVYGSLPPHLASAHSRIRTAAEHLLGLVNDILDLSKIEVGRMDIELERVDIVALIDGVITVVEPSADAKGVRLDVLLGRELPSVVTDPRHVRQILLNLLANAIKFTGRGSVTLYARCGDGERSLEISVEDTGIGIAEADLERIFEEFEQVRPSARGDSLQRGVGLGLAIARKLAHLLDGELRAESVVGSGSRFTLVLPLRVAPEQTSRDGGAPGGDDAVAAHDLARDAESPPSGDASRNTTGTPTPSGEHAAVAPSPRVGRGLDDA